MQGFIDNNQCLELQSEANWQLMQLLEQWTIYNNFFTKCKKGKFIQIYTFYNWMFDKEYYGFFLNQTYQKVQILFCFLTI